MVKLSQIPAILEIQKQLEALPARDLAALKLLSLALFIVVLYFLVWVPSKSYMDESISLHEDRKALLELVIANKQLLRSSSGAGATNRPTMDGQQLVSSVTNIAKQKGLSLKRFEPSGENKLKVWVDDASFDKMISWISTLNKSLGIKVEQISVEREDKPGLISARLTLAS